MALGSAIKSIQQGTGTASVTNEVLTTVNVTITAVVLAKTEVQAWIANEKKVASNVNCTASIAPVLTGTTNLRLFIIGATNASATYTWQIIEYY